MICPQGDGLIWPTWLVGGESSSAATVLLEGCVLGGSGLTSAVGGLAAGWGAEALVAASGNGLEQVFDAEDDGSSAALALQSGAFATFPAGRQW